MKSIDKILVPTDFSENANHAMRYALWFADKVDAEIEICHFVTAEVLPADIPVVSSELTHQKIEVAKVMAQTIVDTSLMQEHTANDLSKPPVITHHIAVGPASALISDHAKDKNFDLIIMGTKGEHNIVERIVGTVTSSTINKSSCPVLIIPEESDAKRISKAAYASQVRESDPLHIWETKTLLEPFDCQIHVVNVIEKESLEKGLTLVDFMELFDSAKENTNLSFHTVFGEDHVGEILEDYVEEHSIDLIVMYKPHRSFFDRLFHKSVTKEIVDEIEVPILIIK